MRRLLSFVALLVLLAPASAFAADSNAVGATSTVLAGRSLVVSESARANEYAGGGDVTIAAPVAGDLSAAGGNVIVSAPVAGDALLAGGFVNVRKPVEGDVRTVAGRVVIESPVGGDVVAVGGVVNVMGSPNYAYLLGGKVSINGAHGPVTIYGADVTLSGEYTGDVLVTASDRLTIADGTLIHGALRYDAPAEATLPAGAHAGSVQYTGRTFLPTAAEARTFALAGVGIFILVRVLAALIAAGLIAGLFPTFTQIVADRALAGSSRRMISTALLGFAVLVATPILLLLLTISFAGIGVALVFGAAYVLLLLLSYLYAGLLAGVLLVRRFTKRRRVMWRDAVMGILVLYIVSLVPILGWIVLVVMWALAAGAIAQVAARFAFGHTHDPLEV